MLLWLYESLPITAYYSSFAVLGCGIGMLAGWFLWKTSEQEIAKSFSQLDALKHDLHQPLRSFRSQPKRESRRRHSSAK